MSQAITKPVFIVGMPRSGTTVFYRALARHPDLAWLSPATRKWPARYGPCRLRSLYRNHRLPVEASRIWCRFARRADDVLEAHHRTPEAEHFYRGVLRNQMRLAHAPRFLCKHPRNGLRIPFFSAIFPDALFIHLLRDGRAVGESILRCRQRAGDIDAWWDLRPPGWRDHEQQSPEEQVGWQWARTVSLLREMGRKLPAERYLEVRYEDFCEAPVATLNTVARFCDLDPLKTPWTELPGIRPQNNKWRDALRRDQVETLERIEGPLLRELGYAPLTG